MAKLDMEKAYDKLEWDFLKKCFFELWFCEKWVKWITRCSTTTTFSILVNGKPVATLSLTRIRHSDSIFLIFYYLCWIFRKIYTFQVYSGIFRYRYQGADSKNFILMCTDDCLIFCMASKKAARNIRDILDYYWRFQDSWWIITNQKFNCLKMSIKLSDRKSRIYSKLPL